MRGVLTWPGQKENSTSLTPLAARTAAGIGLRSAAARDLLTVWVRGTNGLHPRTEGGGGESKPDMFLASSHLVFTQSRTSVILVLSIGYCMKRVIGRASENRRADGDERRRGRRHRRLREAILRVC
jgi:hypothetical protein